MLQTSFTGGLVEAGVDEAGRGCLAGPVYAAAVILSHDYKDNELNDSKQLSAKKKEFYNKVTDHKIDCSLGVYQKDAYLLRSTVLKTLMFQSRYLFKSEETWL